MSRNSNHTRALHDVVSIDAWHSPPPSEEGYSLHLDIAFREAKVGDDTRSKVRFKLAIRRAEIVFVTPSAGGVQVLQSSVAREKAVEGEVQVTLKSNSDAMVKGSVSAKLDSAPSASAELSASTSLSTAQTQTTKFTKPYSEISWKARRSSDGNYIWDLFTETNNSLKGRPWDPISEPRLRFRADMSARLPPTMRIIARCRREDLIIEGIEPKESQGLGAIRDRFKNNRVAAAEAFIKHLLDSESSVNKAKFVSVPGRPGLSASWAVPSR